VREQRCGKNVRRREVDAVRLRTLLAGRGDL